MAEGSSSLISGCCKCSSSLSMVPASKKSLVFKEDGSKVDMRQ